MIIDRNLAKFIIFSEDSLHNALRKISENKARIVFCVSSSGVLEGVLTDGDVRRWITDRPSFDTGVPVLSVANKSFTFLLQDAPHEEIERHFSDRIGFIPLLDRHNHLVAVAHRGAPEVRIGHFNIGPHSQSFLIAEIGNNHNGSLETAKRLIDEAVAAGADCAKFQMRSMAKLYRNSGDANDASADLGAQYTLDLLSRFQLSTEQMFQAFDYCKEKGILPLCTPWDQDSLQQLEGYGMLAYKLASADLTNHDLLEAMASTGKPLICSTGMSSENEIMEAVKLLKRHKASFVLLHCNSTYPAPFKDIHLEYLDRLRQVGDCLVGYSGHERGIAVAIAAVARGAKVIEKHFTLDRSWEGNDHRVSLLPGEFRAMVQSIREVEEALGSGDARRVTQGEMMNREVLAKSLIASCDIAVGEVVSTEKVDVRSPGQGLPPNRKADLIGRKAIRAMKAGDFFYPSDLDDSAARPRAFRFRRPYGVPVRYHDVKRLAAAAPFDLFEFHLSYKDLEEDIAQHMRGQRYHMDLVVHSPELFAGDHIMDLCAPSAEYRQRSIDELQRVVNVTRALSPYFSRAKRPLIIINAGGFSADGPMPVSARGALYERIAESLAKVDQAGVEIIPQTMPPFPWHFGGQRFHNLFMTADEIAAFCKRYGYRVCLDISHSQLTCTHFKTSFKEFLECVGPHSAHLHIVDAEGVDGEGLQIGEGMVDFGMVAEVLNRKAPTASFIPEIWQGHKNEGEGFWVALDRLEKWF
ncbi:N-acetylneuraminate synthase family protein [Azonexus sp. IMCC34839]|uniref:N-acetylneuraminate synthase family protein n=1 Tax=Azonexus sp. IMCC34839 TaxID=3133695 RepID=UPI00399C0AD5